MEQMGEKMESFQIQLCRYLNKQTNLPYLILYTYLFWYLFLMITVGAKHMSLESCLTGIFVATFVFCALNSAAYHPPLCGPKGYIKHPFKIARFFAIPFCVSTSSIACSVAGRDECILLIPVDQFLFIIQISGMVVIFVTGFIIHCAVSPLLSRIDKLEQIKHRLENPKDIKIKEIK